MAAIGPRAGFSLVEVLVVIALIGLLGGIALLALPSPATHARNEAERLHHTLQLAADEAVYANTEIALTPSATGYAFTRYDPVKKTWLPLREKAFAPHTLPEGLRLSLTLSGTSFTPQNEAAIIFQPSGEMTPFTLTVSDTTGNHFLISADGINPITLQAP
ncbi:MAG: type II secretion system minor pseudopilin GspH [Rickettsiales bacterium]|nr:type II secretion system minor pseudopilin GspH [Rickettsiales bacterium]